MNAVPLPHSSVTNEAVLGVQRKESVLDGLDDEPVDGIDRRSPLAHVERPQLASAGVDGPMRRHGLRADDEAARLQRCVNSAQGVHDALKHDSSKRPAAQRQVEPSAGEIERLRIADREADTVAELARERIAGLRHGLWVGIEGVHLRGTLRREGGQPPDSAADLEDPLAVKIGDCSDRRSLSGLAITPQHLATPVDRRPRMQSLPDARTDRLSISAARP
jgi:hypothetical protein